ncbi:MAG: DUF3592 domain-containing protein, partial [Alphaproteobacteria bacterium]|nr:DUF3592 domain-containing protein [Alphaproteobacteria bacterium]
LKISGQRIEAEITGVDFNTSLRVNGRSPWVIRAQWYDVAQGGVRTFESESLWFDPAPYLDKRKTIGVFIDPAKPGRYAVDTSFLPKHLE